MSHNAGPATSNLDFGEANKVNNLDDANRCSVSKLPGKKARFSRIRNPQFRKRLAVLCLRNFIPVSLNPCRHPRQGAVKLQFLAHKLAQRG
jgi:hypothetical protein